MKEGEGFETAFLIQMKIYNNHILKLAMPCCNV